MKIDHDNLHPPDRSGIWVLFPFIVAAVVIGIGWGFWKNSPRINPGGIAPRPEITNTTARRDVTLFFPELATMNWNSERTEISGYDSERQEIQRCLEALLSGPGNSKNKLLNGSISVDRVFIDTDQLVYLELGFPDAPPNLGGIGAERMVMEAVTRTLAANFPELTAVRFISDNPDQSTFAGHIDITHPIQLN